VEKSKPGLQFARGAGPVADIEQFLLKDFFYAPDAGKAAYNLSRSFAEPMAIGELLALEPDAREKLDEIALGYPGVDGSAPLRAAIAERYPGISPEMVIATAGLDDALAGLALALVEPGDRVIVQTPAYQTYMSVPRWRGAEVAEWRAREENAWLPDLDELEALLEQPARWVIINFPNNPTGVMPDAAYFERLVELARSRDTLVISDEIYAGLPQGGAPFEPLCCRYGRAVSLHSVSKTLGVPGLRVGWIVCRDDVIRNRIKDLRFHFNSFIGAPSEFLGALALRHEAEILQRNSKILADNIDTANAFMARHDNLFGWTPPAAGVNAWPQWHGPGDSEDLSDAMLRDAKLLIAHSALFLGGERNVRLGLGCLGLDTALERFDDFLQKSFR
jgi:aspartate/methionine/tyrosine aminotransferase